MPVASTPLHTTHGTMRPRQGINVKRLGCPPCAAHQRVCEQSSNDCKQMQSWWMSSFVFAFSRHSPEAARVSSESYQRRITQYLSSSTSGGCLAGLAYKSSARCSGITRPCLRSHIRPPACSSMQSERLAHTPDTQKTNSRLRSRGAKLFHRQARVVSPPAPCEAPCLHTRQVSGKEFLDFLGGVPGHGKLTKPSQNRGSELSNATTVQQGNGVVDITRSKDGLDLMPANAAATATPARGHPGVLPGHNKR